MKVETFEVQEIAFDGSVDDFGKTSELVEKLNLEGQMQFLNKGTNEVVPYRKMTAQERAVYGTLCQSITSLKKYNDGIIPLRVLEVAAYATECGMFNEIEIWHQTNADVKDPVLVGKVKKGNWDYEYFILARWGEELDTFETLLKKAAVRLVDKVKVELSQAKAKIDQDMASVEMLVKAKLMSGQTPSVSYYGI